MLDVLVEDGASKSRMDATSTCPPLAEMHIAASSASRELSEPRRSDAEKTRNLTGSLGRLPNVWSWFICPASSARNG